MTVWVFTWEGGPSRQARWYWTKNDPDVIESAHSFGTFEDCIACARAYGFDFSAAYYITTSRETLASELRRRSLSLVR